jgi:hypothetical protein
MSDVNKEAGTNQTYKNGSISFIDALHPALDRDDEVSGYLGDSDTVVSVLKQFLAHVASTFESGASSDDERREAIQSIADDCASTADIFLGKDPEYRGMPNWNGPGLVQFLKEHSGIDLSGADEPDDDQSVVELYFATLASLYLHQMTLHSDGQTTDDDLQSFVNGTLENARNTLMGLST